VFGRLESRTLKIPKRGKDSAREILEYSIPDFSDWQTPDAYTSAFKKLLEALKPE